MDMSKLSSWIELLPYIGFIWFGLFVYLFFDFREKGEENFWYSSITDSLIISGDVTLTMILMLTIPSKWLIWILLNLFLWSFLISKTKKNNREKEEKDKSKTVPIMSKKEKLKKELNDYRIIQIHKERRRKFGEDELNQLIGYIVYNKDRVKNSNRYDSSVVDIFNEMYQDGLKKGKSNSQIVEEIDDFFESRLSRNLSYDMNERFRTLVTKLDGISYLDEDETEVKVEKVRRPSIPQSVKDRVWNRDGGKCVQCGSNEKIEFDHIIPFSKGGTDTYRNLQILCEKCNRSKSDKIG